MTTGSAWQTRDVIHWGILGCGDVTEVKSGPGFQKSEGSRLVAVMRRNAELAQDYARRHAVPKWYSDAEALIRDPEVDAVYIATPPGSHLEYALRVAAAGKPAHVEKPMARNITECDQMVEAFARARLPLFVAYYRRAQPRFLRAKELIETMLGRVTAIRYQFTDPRHITTDPARALAEAIRPAAPTNVVVDEKNHRIHFQVAAKDIAAVIGPGGEKARQLSRQLGYMLDIQRATEQAPANHSAGALPWRLEAENAGGGFFLDLGSHTLDLLDFFFGPLEDVAGHAANLASPYAVEDTLAMNFRTTAGVPGTAAWNFAGAAREDFFQITGTNGRLTFSTFGQEPLRLELAGGATQEFPFTPPPHVAQPLVQAVVNDLRGLGPCSSTGESARRTTRVMDRVLDTYYGGRTDAFWTRAQHWPGRRAD